MKNKSLLTFSLLLINQNFLFSQDIIGVKDIIGEAFIYGDISPNVAKTQALNEAKIEALKRAGIGENINSYQLLLSSQQKNEYSQFFSSSIESEIQGAVQSYQIKSEKTYCKSENEIVYEIHIDAEVVKYDLKPDITFDANIEGIKGVYNNDESLKFSLKTTQACFLTIFDITDKDAFVLYPNDYEKQFKFDSSVSYNFPISNIEYTLHTDLKERETNQLIFVFTKTQFPFIKMNKDQITTSDIIFNWIYSISPDQRTTEYFTLTIHK